MAEPFRDRLDAAAVAGLAASVRRAWPAFPVDVFVAQATDGLDALGLKDRVGHVGTALRAALPRGWPEAVGVLVAALPPALADDGAVTVNGFQLWPVLYVVEAFGADDPATSLPALRDMTRRFSAEFAIRPLLARHPEPTWAALTAWAADPDPHVRRLVSEGSRPRLPWGMRLQDAVRDPSRGLALLERLVDDPSAYVRRSVANHLGDVAKDHPERAVEVARRWIAERPDREPLVRHGLRDLLKKGHAGALAVVGHDGGGVEVSDVRVARPEVRVGEPIEVSARVVAHEGGTVRVDAVWSWPGARAGAWSSKTFRGPVKTLAAGEAWAPRVRLSTRPVTTRPLRPGPQRVRLRVNGADGPDVDVLLLDA